MLTAPDSFADRLTRICPGTSLIWRAYGDGVSVVMPVVGHFFRRWKAADGTIWHREESGYGEAAKPAYRAAPAARSVGRWQVCERGIQSGDTYVIFDAVNSDGSSHPHNDALIQAVKKRERPRFAPTGFADAAESFREERFKERTSRLVDAGYEAAGHWFEKTHGITHHFLGATPGAQKVFELRIVDKRTSTRMATDGRISGDDHRAHP